MATIADNESDSEGCKHGGDVVCKCFEKECVVGEETELVGATDKTPENLKEPPSLSEYVAIAFNKKTQKEKKKELLCAVVDQQHELLVVQAKQKVIQKNHINAILYQAKFRAVHGEMRAMNNMVEPQLPDYFIAQCFAHYVAYVVILRCVLLIWPALANTILK